MRKYYNAILTTEGIHSQIMYCVMLSSSLVEMSRTDMGKAFPELIMPSSVFTCRFSSASTRDSPLTVHGELQFESFVFPGLQWYLKSKLLATIMTRYCDCSYVAVAE